MKKLMEVDPEYFKERKSATRAIFDAQKTIYCPYFRADVVLNSDGFHHLQFSARREREKKTQLLKFSLLPLALEVIRKSGTAQEYRKTLILIGKPSRRDGAVPMKEVEYWAMVAIVREYRVKLRVILRRIGTGNVIFWSVMPDVKWRDGKQKLAVDGIEDD